MCAGVISSVEMSSRSLGLFCGFLVSQGRSSPVSCRLISSGSSVRKRMRALSCTVPGSFSIFLFSSASITSFLFRRVRLYFTPSGEVITEAFKRGLRRAHREGRFNKQRNSFRDFFTETISTNDQPRRPTTVFQIWPTTDGRRPTTVFSDARAYDRIFRPQAGPRSDGFPSERAGRSHMALPSTADCMHD